MLLDCRKSDTEHVGAPSEIKASYFLNPV
jgi:hypothetical protein